MKKILFLVLVLVSSFANAGMARRTNYVQLFLPLGERCEQYYSLYDESKICLKGELHFRAYEITYTMNGQTKTVRLTYIPKDNFEVDDNGIVKPRNQEVAPDQRF